MSVGRAGARRGSEGASESAHVVLRIPSLGSSPDPATASRGRPAGLLPASTRFPVFAGQKHYQSCHHGSSVGPSVRPSVRRGGSCSSLSRRTTSWIARKWRQSLARRFGSFVNRAHDEDDDVGGHGNGILGLTVGRGGGGGGEERPIGPYMSSASRVSAQISR